MAASPANGRGRRPLPIAALHPLPAHFPATFRCHAVSNTHADGLPPTTPRARPPIRRAFAGGTLRSRIRVDRDHVCHRECRLALGRRLAAGPLAIRRRPPLSRPGPDRRPSVDGWHAALFDQLRHERRPPCLVRRPESSPCVAVEVFVKQHELAPIWIALKQL